MTHLETTDAVIRALGGLTATGQIVGNRKPQVVYLWRKRNKFPADTYLILNAALEQKGHTAPLTLWGMQSPERGNA